MDEKPQTLIEQYRDANNWTQKKLATIMSCSQSQIWKHETGQNSPTIEWLRQYAKAFNVTVSDILLPKDKAESFAPDQIILNAKWNNLTNNQKASVIDLMTSMSKPDWLKLYQLNTATIVIVDR